MNGRRNFFRFFGVSIFSLLNINFLFGKDQYFKDKEENKLKSVNEMRPGEIMEALAKAPFAFVPISPTFEWHSFHLPVGCDALISEKLASIMAEKTGGIWFRSLSFGLDAWRNKEQKSMWGFKQGEEVFGMNFPDVPLESEYCEKPEMLKAIKNRVEPLTKAGVKHVFLINHHGGEGQFETIEKAAKELSSDKIRVHAIKTYDLNTLTEKDGFYKIGGHAGYSETLFLMAFRPELIDLSRIEKGKLSVRETGILNESPVIDEKWNPVNVKKEVAEKIHETVVKNFSAYLEKETKNLK